MAISQGIIRDIQTNPHIDDSLYTHFLTLKFFNTKENRKHALMQNYAFEERKESVEIQISGYKCVTDKLGNLILQQREPNIIVRHIIRLSMLGYQVGCNSENNIQCTFSST